MAFYFGASDLTRTGDLLITSEMHYRLCYTSVLNLSYYSGFHWLCQLIFESPGWSKLHCFPWEILL